MKNAVALIISELLTKRRLFWWYKALTSQSDTFLNVVLALFWF
jgi:hypothetical protein